MKELTFLEAERVRRAREKLAAGWEKVAAILTKEIAAAEKAKVVPKELVEKLKLASDQIRRDFRLEPEAGGEKAPATPLAGLRIVADDDEAEAA